MKKLEISRKDRIAAVCINMIFMGITFGFSSLFNLIFYSVHGKTAGSYFIGFATRKADGTPPGFDGAVLYWLVRIFVRLLYILTIGILFIYEMSTLEKRNGNLVESIINQRKVHNFGS